jgi:hypothetical protein
MIVPPGATPAVNQELMQSYGPDEEPFLCLPGVRAYHEHPGHTGDSWLLHRARGDGRLITILTHLHKYGIANLSLNFEVQVRAKFYSEAQP